MLEQSQYEIAEVGKGHAETGLPGSVDRVGQLRWDSSGHIDLLPCLRHVLFLDPALTLAGEDVAARQVEGRWKRMHQKLCQEEAFDCQQMQRASVVGLTPPDQE